MQKFLIFAFWSVFVFSEWSSSTGAQTLEEILERVKEDSQPFVAEFPILQRFSYVEGADPQGYFPAEAMSSEFQREWYTNHLNALEESSLFSSKCASRRCARFTWLRTRHAPIAIRVEFHADGRATLNFKQTNGLGGYDAGVLAVSETRDLSSSAATEIEAKLKSILQNTAYEHTHDIPGNDGAEWIIEYRSEEAYIFAVQWTPRSGDILAFGMALLDLSDFEGAKRSPVY